MTDYARWLRTVATHVEQNDPVKPCHKALRRAADKLDSQGREAFFAGCDYGSNYAGAQYLGTPERQRGFDQWKRTDE